MTTPTFDPEAYKSNTRAQWDQSGAGYDAWGPTLTRLIRPAQVRLVDLAGLEPGQSLLELACGPGAMTMLLAETVGPEGRIVATDLSPGMVALARKNLDAAGHGHVETRTLDGEAVGELEGQFDAVVSCLGLMFFPDPVGSLVAQRQAVRPGGRVAAVVISGPQNNPFFSIPARVIREAAGLPMPPPGMPGPFALGAPGHLAALFEEAGLTDVVSESVAATIELASVDEHLNFLKDAFGALHMMMRGMSEDEVEATWKQVATALMPFQNEDGFRAPGELILCVGRAPN